MDARPLAITFMLLAAVLSFALAIYRSLQGAIPVVETAHALMFALFGLLLVARPDPAQRDSCSECGADHEEGFRFCLHCGRVPKARHPSAGAA